MERSAGAIIFKMEIDLRKYLLLKYRAGHWDYVKGHIEERESLQDTLIRETWEETGLTDLRVIDGFEKKISYFYTHDRRRISKEVVFFLAETKTQEIRLSHEHTAYLWLSYDDAVKKTTFETSKKVLREAEGFISKN